MRWGLGLSRDRGEKRRLARTRSTGVTVVTLIGGLAAGQPVAAQSIEFSGGVNIARISGDAIESAVRNIGPNFGIDFVLPLGPFGLNLGADWSSKGVEGLVDGATENTLIDLTYIELPVHARFPLTGAGPLRLNLILGPTIGINTGCDLSVDAGAVEECADAVGGFEVNSLDWSAAAGLGLSFSLGGLAYAGADLKYTLGLTAVGDQIAEDIRNRAFTLQAHVGFDVF